MPACSPAAPALRAFQPPQIEMPQRYPEPPLHRKSRNYPRWAFFITLLELVVVPGHRTGPVEPLLQNIERLRELAIPLISITVTRQLSLQFVRCVLHGEGEPSGLLR